MPESPQPRNTGIILRPKDDDRINAVIAQGLRYRLRLNQTEAIRILIHATSARAIPERMFHSIKAKPDADGS